MKRCNECARVYEDHLDMCPTCGEVLEPLTSERGRSAQTAASSARRSAHTIEPDRGSAYVFEQQRGRRSIINGSVVDVNTQQYYQSRGTKIVQALLRGEPYQLGYTTFMTVIRVEEHTDRGFPEQARDILLFGNVQNVFSAGDDVTIHAKRRGNRLIADRIFNHSINSAVHIQPHLPAGVIRALAIAVFFALLTLIMNLSAIGDGIVSLIIRLFSAALPILILVFIGWFLIRGLFRR